MTQMPRLTARRQQAGRRTPCPRGDVKATYERPRVACCVAAFIRDLDVASHDGVAPSVDASNLRNLCNLRIDFWCGINMRIIPVIALLVASTASALAQSSDVTIKARLVLDGKGQAMNDAVVTVRDGKIVRVGTAACRRCHRSKWTRRAARRARRGCGRWCTRPVRRR